MKDQFSLFDLLLLIGITQGLVTSILLITSKKNRRSNRFLALGIIAFCLLSAKMLWHTLGLWDTQYIRYFPNAVEVVIAPLFYFFIVFLLNSNLQFTWKQALHFVPFAISQTYAFIVYFSVVGIKDIAEKDSIGEALYFNQVKHTEDYLGLLSIFIYLFLSYLKLKDYKQWLNNTTADNTYPDFKWLKQIFGLSAVLGVFAFINHFADLVFDLKSSYYFHWETFYLYMAFLVYYIGFIGYKQPYHEISMEVERPSSAPSEQEKANMDKIAIALETSMLEDKLYLNPTLSVNELAQKLNVSQRQISNVINSKFQKSFRAYINSHRINEVEKKLQSSDLKQLSILGIALECGFNSEASFYRVFKNHTGMSPKEFLKKKTL